MNRLNLTDEKKSEGGATQLLIRRDQTTYLVGVHFTKDGRETIDEKVRRLLRKETMQT